MKTGVAADSSTDDQFNDSSFNMVILTPAEKIFIIRYKVKVKSIANPNTV